MGQVGNRAEQEKASDLEAGTKDQKGFSLRRCCGRSLLKARTLEVFAPSAAEIFEEDTCKHN